ncbi:MAG: putative methionine transporter, ATP-binding protein MetN [Solirubrobacterales bacterium]|nr:putative methionine transporter, ATP-binding protein MetN [Solirubrobacterales bacterium]
MGWGFEMIDVTKQAGGRPVLDGVNLGARMGLVTAVIGPAGSGKTMLFRLLAGLERPDTGAVLVAGRDIAAARGRARKKIQRRMGVVFQGTDAGLFAGVSVRENVEFPMRAAGRVPGRRLGAVAQEQLERFGLADHAEARPDALAPAQRRCLALARAVALRAPLMLVDGFDDDLDPGTLRRVCAILREENAARAATWLLTLRDPALAALVADEAVELPAPGPVGGAFGPHSASSAVMRR